MISQLKPYKSFRMTIVIKNILILFSIFCMSAAYSQNDEWIPAKIILKNGTSFRGQVKLPTHSGANLSSEGIMSFGDNKVSYRKNTKSPKKKYGSNEVDEIIFGDEQFATEHYKYVPIRKKKSILMELVVSGKVQLYRTDNNYFLLRENDEVAKLLVDNQNTFHTSVAKAYFSDCEKIAYYLENELYNFDNITELVEDYNLLCE